MKPLSFFSFVISLQLKLRTVFNLSSSPLLSPTLLSSSTVCFLTSFHFPSYLLFLASLRYDAVFAAIRDCYEAYAVYTFIALLIAILVDGQGLPHLINKVSFVYYCSYSVSAFIFRCECSLFSDGIHLFALYCSRYCINHLYIFSSLRLYCQLYCTILHYLSQLAAHVVEERRALSEAIVKKTRRPAMHLRPPFPCCYTQHKPYTVAAAWLFQCQLMTMQVTLSLPLVAVNEIHVPALYFIGFCVFLAWFGCLTHSLTYVFNQSLPPSLTH